MLTIGFTNQYYTLWNVSTPYKHYFDEYNWEMRVDKAYLQNLSQDLEEAKKKVLKLNEDYTIDLELRGEQGSRFTVSTGVKGSDLKEFQFPLGRCEGDDIRTSEDTGALWNMYLKKSIWNNEVEAHSFKNLNPNWVRPCVYARRRLFELGAIIRYDGQYMTPEYKETYIQKKEKEAVKEAAEAGHHFENGDKVELEIKEIDGFSFEGNFGTTFVRTYASKCGKLFKYMGASPKDVSNSEFEKVKATIKHDNYNNVAETKLQRIKLI